MQVLLLSIEDEEYFLGHIWDGKEKVSCAGGSDDGDQAMVPTPLC